MRHKCLFLSLLFMLFTSISVASENIVVTLPNGSRAVCRFPQNYNSAMAYPLMVALHGKGQTAETACEAWQDIADRYHYVILAPEGTGTENIYVKDVTGNAENVIDFVDILNDQVRLIPGDILLVGFSMGGSFALDLALRHPNKFRKVIVVCGFFIERHKYWAEIQNREYINKQRYLLVTGPTDYTFAYLCEASRLLAGKGARVQLNVYSDLIHDLPENYDREFSQVEKYFYSY